MSAPARLVATMCIVEALGMAAFAAFPTLIPLFQREWGISNTEAGWISGIYFAGYVLAVAALTAATDRMPARRIYLACMALSALSAAGFATADGVWSASAWRLAQGVGLAGTYMPGLKALTDAIPERLHSRATAFYTSSFGVGSGLSYYLSGQLAALAGWQLTFVLLALGPLAALLAAAFVLPATAQRGGPIKVRWLDFRPAFANRRALGFTLAYTAHNAELFAFRSWLVAFLVFAHGGSDGATITAATVAALVNLAGMPASVLGNELAARLGRQRTTTLIMASSATVGVLFALSAAWPYWLVVGLAFLYGITITGESATVTAGVIKVADPSLRGTTLAVHSVVGFIGAFAGPLLFGVVLDAAGGQARPVAWIAAFGAMGAIVLLGPLAIARLVGLRDPVR